MNQVKFVEDMPLKDLKEYGLFKQITLLQNFYRLSSTNFTWSILEYCFPFVSEINTTFLGSACYVFGK